MQGSFDSTKKAEEKIIEQLEKEAAHLEAKLESLNQQTTQQANLLHQDIQDKLGDRMSSKGAPSKIIPRKGSWRKLKGVNKPTTPRKGMCKLFRAAAAGKAEADVIKLGRFKIKKANPQNEESFLRSLGFSVASPFFSSFSKPPLSNVPKGAQVTTSQLHSFNAEQKLRYTMSVDRPEQHL